MARISIEGDRIVVKLSLREKLVTLKFGDIAIPLDSVEGVNLLDSLKLRLRLRGMSLGDKRVGLFLDRDGRKVFVITTGTAPIVSINVKKDSKLGMDALIVDAGVDGFDELAEKLNITTGSK